ncbi:hypothetical protein GE061_018333 [Apolygus lucorum]|uniref:BESS domain-containing protein n=1 Tax=Apolygus lucorum TaxID=248454 RepID=A0A8S9XEZ2_APOLU|nr:hypothetical protein GE061_018333 [Apolygus lucorum]
MSFTSEEDEILIDFEKNHECLFNVATKDFRNTQLKLSPWKEMGTTINKTEGLFRRRTLFPEIGKRKINPSSSGSDDTSEGGRSPLSIPQPKKQRKTSLSEERMQILKQIAAKNSSPYEMDENDLFFSSMAKSVKRLPPPEQARIRMEVGQLVGSAEVAHFSRDIVEEQWAQTKIFDEFILIRQQMTANWGKCTSSVDTAPKVDTWTLT